MPESIERGALTEAVYYIMLSLCSPLHGYGIMQNVKELSQGRVDLGAGTLYGALNTLVQKGWIQPHDSDVKSRKKEYIITQPGKDKLRDELKRLQELMANGQRILDEQI